MQIPKKQSAFTLTAIQVTGATSLPVLHAAVHLHHQYGFFLALVILFFVNLLTYCAAFTVIKMTAGTTKNTLENARETIGFLGGYLVALILILSMVAWFILQTNLATEVVRALFAYNDFDNINTFIQIGVGLGIISTLVSMEGIVGLRWMSRVALPLILLCFAIFSSFLPFKPIAVSSSEGSLMTLVIALGASLSLAVDYPTFFQFSRSKRSSYMAISAIQLITFLMGVGGLFLGRYVSDIRHLSDWEPILGGHLSFKICLLLLVVFSCLSVNALNIFSASIGWEVVVPILAGRKEYTILGLGMTAAFVLMTELLPMEQLREITEISLSNLCLVLIIGYLSRLFSKAPLPSCDRWLFFLAWVSGTGFSLVSLHIANISLFILGFLITIIIAVATLAVRYLFSHKAKPPRQSP